MVCKNMVKGKGFAACFKIYREFFPIYLHKIMLLLCNKRSVNMPNIIPIKELRDTTKSSERCHDSDELIFATKNGYGDMVIMSMETYHKVPRQNETDAAITMFEKELAEGTEFLDAKEALETLRRKHLG